jgi:hypothetical protein
MNQPTKSHPVGNRRKKVSDLPAEYSKDLSEKVKWDVVAVCKHELRKRKNEGKYGGNPEDFHPARFLASVVEDESVHTPIRVVAAKELMPYFGIDKATQAKIDAGISDGHITVHIESYAQTRPVPAIEAKPVIDIVAKGKELLLHRNSAPSPEVKIEKYQAFDVVNGVAEPVTAAPVVTNDEPVVITDSAGNTYTVKRSV